MTVSNFLAFMVYPKDFDPSKKYPVHVDLYGGPDTPQVSDGSTASILTSGIQTTA